ncbi:TetR/AcrR family transcriptional regulator [Mesorhizobium sp. M2A.F.Ca.ET.037.01.1.1]|uniref:TetR/AcrR family transcriptional regulator n=1 Tax=unclassified Mesorhizobium TaxID=325217 RepID=UPI000FCB4534|nr:MULTISPECIES: TetR/AcrR family transcriptional regulator [unclassified Mesorhizobium]RUY13174.1 TetR/AcrR family transcriptional regulator [Mesorhizobium sp. M2A.F.Ca.ET.040.01.1.1]RUX22681.1 TetR/AcrR family transcriptional regulator [Mesorhizobium sp. M2A.F.Ca.ET.037.01.1.1]RVD46070.1 TetR/AcrR family transcriptional regulator [Mesorhizobium sp. M4B.F.Ca.ET.019.03.1.1]RWA91582.1 MAG: TetR/AcrR family transcriptional regulator [Mesorhizobium sp.]TGT41891.1 TetR/AcrR family transcriptional 
MIEAETTQERILQATLDLIWARSVGNVSTDMVCKRAKVSKSSLYHFFPSKSDLVVAAYEFHWKRVAADYAQVFKESMTAEEQLKAYVAITTVDLARQKELTGKILGCPYVLGAAEMSTLDEKVRAVVESVFDRIIGFLEKAVAVGVRAGSFKVDDARVAAQDLYMMMTGAVLQSKVRNSPDFIGHVWPMMRARLVG